MQSAQQPYREPTSFSPYSCDVRLVECPQCGSLVSTGVMGGKPICQSCRTQFVVGPRRSDAAPAPRLSEAQRLAGLVVQKENFAPTTALIGVPANMAHAVDMLSHPGGAPAALELFRQGWLSARQRIEARQPMDELQLLRLVTTLARLYRDQGQHEQARATLETAMDAISDRDKRDMICLTLAQGALGMGDYQSAQAWLRDVNPTPLRIELDSAYRLAWANLCFATERYQDIVDVLGESSTDIPILDHGSNLILAECLRSHGLAAVGKPKLARKAIERAVYAGDSKQVEEFWKHYPGPASSMVRGARWRANLATVGGGALILGGAGLAFALFLSLFVTPSCAGCALPGNQSDLDLVLERLRSCPETRAALGDDITWRLGRVHYGNSFHGFDVKGSRADGRVNFSVNEVNGKKVLKGSLKVGNSHIEICQP